MPRKKSSMTFNDSLEVESSSPLDGRTGVDTKEDLLHPDSFPYKYIGMPVFVKSELKRYELIDEDTTNPDSWREIGSGGNSYDDTAISNRIKTVEDAMAVLNGDTTVDGSVAKAISAAVNGLIDGAPGTYDTLKEISDYIESDATAAAAMAAAIAEKYSQADANALSQRVDDLEDAMQTTGTSDGKTAVAINIQNGIGNYKAGDSIPAQTSFEQILKTMLSKTVVPSFTPPTAVISTTASKLLERGSTVPAVFTVSLNRGTINPANGTSGFRSGEATGYILNGGAEQAQNTFNETVSETNKEFEATVKYAAGEQPKDSDGNDYDEPLQAGQVVSNKITFEFVDALYSNQAAIGTIAKEPLVSKTVGTKTFNFPAQTEQHPMLFEVPASWTVTAVEALNTLSNQWANCLADFTITDVEHNGIAYKRYTDDRGYAEGARQVRIKWS